MTLRDDIIAIPENDYRTLGHYLVYCLAVARLPQNSNGSHTEAALNEARRFLSDVVSIWNETHSQEIDAVFLWEMAKAMRDKDLQEYEQNTIIAR